MGRQKISIDEYREGLEKRFGNEFIADFDAIFSGDTTLSKLSKKYRLSKMRSTQIFQRLYGKTYRDAKNAGSVKDSSGTTFTFEPGKNRNFMIIVPDELYYELKKYSNQSGLSMSAIVRDCVSDFLSKDGLGKLSNFF